MPDNLDSDNEKFKDLPDTESGHANDTDQITNPTQNQETENMEVHHHAHAHGKKSWTAYFYEFLMLFLAVFCGFLAEYQLEHKIERDREKQFIRSLLQDLREDITTFSENIDEFTIRVSEDDSLIMLLGSPDIRNYGAPLYYLGRRASRTKNLALNDFSVQQMKNSGGFRLIRNEKVAKGIIEYYNRIVHINFLMSIAMTESNEYRKVAVEIFNPFLFNEMVRTNNSIVRPGGNPALLTYEPSMLMRLAGLISYFKNTKFSISKSEEEMKQAAEKLIELIKIEYEL